MSDSEISTGAETPLVFKPSPLGPDHLVAPASDEVAAEIAALLPETAGQIGLVATCLANGVTELKDLVEAKAAANPGAASNLMSNIRAIRDQDVPPAPSRAVQARSAARSFLRQHESVLSVAARTRLEDLITKLSAVVDDTEAQVKEEGDLAAKGDALEEVLLKEGGVYVYTYPHYWRHPTVEGTRRTLLKVGMTTKEMRSGFVSRRMPRTSQRSPCSFAVIATPHWTQGMQKGCSIDSCSLPITTLRTRKRVRRSGSRPASSSSTRLLRRWGW